MSPKKHNFLGSFVKLLSILIIAGLAVAIFLNRQNILDEISVWQFKPSSQVSELINRTGMNARGKFLYYASQPKIDGTQTFNTECGRTETTTAILGCYVNYRIYVYDVTDTQLDGIMEVTAAHETLHAAYQRLGASEKKYVDTLLEAEYTKLEADPSYKARMDYYAKAEPGQRDNELHSVIGTEVKDLSPQLENYYKQYFTNRQAVVSLSEKYKRVFDSISSQASALTDQLNTLSASIKAESAVYNADVETLNNAISTFNSKANNGGFTSQSEFNSERASLVAQADTLSSKRTAINDDVSTYNAKLQQYNSLATQSKQLNNSIDSTLAPAPSV